MNNICENCGCSHDGSYGSGRFCSAKCARCFSTKRNRADISKKVSTKLLKRREIHQFKTDFSIRYCSECGKQLGIKNTSGLCCRHFQIKVHATAEYREKIRQSQLRLVASGTHKGWRTRNITSYAEKFFETVLNNNRISYDRERHVGKYFLDFVIGQIDLEIDGKQHEYPERRQSDMERDRFLRSKGYFVYRIKWNEINSEDGKTMMKDKIDLLIDFIERFN